MYWTAIKQFSKEKKKHSEQNYSRWSLGYAPLRKKVKYYDEWCILRTLSTLNVTSINNAFYSRIDFVNHH